ncbi:MAG: NusG domain II-containing protein [Treponema sp.]
MSIKKTNNLLKLCDFFIFFIFLCIIFISFRMITVENENLVLEISTPECRYAFDLGRNRKIAVKGIAGETLIVIENKNVFFQESPCTNKICVHAGRISKAGQWICCVPNKIFAVIKSGNSSNSRDNPNEADAFSF